MSRQATQAVESFVQEPEVYGTKVGIAEGWADYGDLVVWEEGVVESVFAVALLEDAPFIDDLGCEDPQRGVGKDRGKALRLVEGPIFVIPEDKYAAFGAVWVVVTVAFDP